MNADIKKLFQYRDDGSFVTKPPGVKVETIGKLVCGMLNARGGVVMIGFSEKAELLGVPDVEKLIEEINGYISGRMSPLPFFSVSSHKAGDKAVVMVEVPEGADKPYSFERSIYVRVGKQTLKANTDTTASLVKESAIKLARWESEPLPGFDLSDCDDLELLQAKHEIMSSGRMGTRSLHDDSELLQRLNLTQGGQLTNGAAVLFARDPLSWSPNLAIRIVSFVSDKSSDIANDTLISGPAVRAFHDACTRVQQLTGYSGRFDSDSVERVDVPAYPAIALREGLVNAIVHRDYTLIGGRIQVEIYPDHLVIQNPGCLPRGWKVADLKKRHGSVPFNPDIARVFHLRGLMEQLGIGTQKMIGECKRIGSAAPKWSDTNGMVTLTLFASSAPEQSFDLNSRQQILLKKYGPGTSFKTSDYAELTGVVDRQARRELNELIDYGLVERSGRGPATIYIRTKRAAS